ncbi:hypothetical protein ASG22_06770 [Chryseobacterium sp. Leaf405]|nr:hypothetical protein ASG22_06770 [Chryseobacterium sp. Leaf405]
MYYFELIQRFWDYNTKKPIGSAAIAAYLFLLKTSNENDRYDFKISDVVVSRELGLSRKTVIKTREKLKNLGLIDFQTPKGHPCHYRILLNNSLQFLVEDEKKVTEQENDDIKTEENDHIIVEELLQKELVSEILQNNQPENNEALIESQQDHKDIGFPSFSEFLDYAQTLNAFDPQLETGIREKYETWISNGWTNNLKRPITNWKSSLKSALPFINNSVDTDIFSAKSIPDIKRPKFP